MTNILNNIRSVRILSLSLWHLCLKLSQPFTYSGKKLGCAIHFHVNCGFRKKNGQCTIHLMSLRSLFGLSHYVGFKDVLQIPQNKPRQEIGLVIFETHNRDLPATEMSFLPIGVVVGFLLLAAAHISSLV